MGGNTNRAGRVEVYHDGVWGTVCDDSWNLDDASVICRTLGLGEALGSYGNAAYGEGIGDILLDEVRCDGTESDIFECLSNDIGSHDCMHNEDAGVSCGLGK